MVPESPPRRFGDVAPSNWPGERLGLQQSGHGSVARLGRRVIAICIDWAAALLIALLFSRYASPEHSWGTIAVFGIMQILFIPTLGGSMGQRIVGLRVVALVGGWVGLWRPVIRTVLLLAVLPVLVWDSDHRGFHDKIAGTVLIVA
jgi:uncharacterized RDD family membrane protein YckC